MNLSGRQAGACGLLALGLLSAISAAPAGATPSRDVAFTIRPAHPDFDNPKTASWLVQKAEPGETIRDSVIVQNLADQPVELILYAADAGTTPTGDFSVAPFEAEDTDVATWVSLGQQKVRLGAREAREVLVRVRVPDDATPGDHPGAIVARTARPIDRDGFLTHLAVGARLYLRVNGPLGFALRVHGIDVRLVDGQPHFLIELENAGNTLVEVGASYGIQSLSGPVVGEAKVAVLASLVPGSRATREVVPREPVPAGTYRARFVFRYEGGEIPMSTSRFQVPGPPWLPILLIVVVLVAISVWGWDSRRVRAHAAGRSAARMIRFASRASAAGPRPRRPFPRHRVARRSVSPSAEMPMEGSAATSGEHTAAPVKKGHPQVVATPRNGKRH